MASTSRGAFFGNVVDPQPAILSEKMNSVANIFQLVCVHFRSTSFKIDVKKKKVTILKFTVCYIAIHFQPLQLDFLNDWSMVNLQKKQS